MSADRPRVLPTREGYDRWADTYDTMGNWLLALEEPEVDRALGDVADLDVLDAGCGTGRHALRLAEARARVTAIAANSKNSEGRKCFSLRPRQSGSQQAQTRFSGRPQRLGA